MRLSLLELMQCGARGASDMLDRAERELAELSWRVERGDYADRRALANVKAYIRRRRRRIGQCRRTLFGAGNNGRGPR